jgi:hypothetical protein
MKLYRVVVHTVTEYVVKAENQEQAQLRVSLPGTEDWGQFMEVTESISQWSEPVRLVGTEYVG